MYIYIYTHEVSSDPFGRPASQRAPFLDQAFRDDAEEPTGQACNIHVRSPAVSGGFKIGVYIYTYIKAQVCV